MHRFDSCKTVPAGLEYPRPRSKTRLRCQPVMPKTPELAAEQHPVFYETVHVAGNA